jgi:hypothetical protein
VAAVLLVFHGAAVLRFPRSMRRGGAQPGALPRDVSRAVSNHAASPKGRPTKWLPDHPPHALRQAGIEVASAPAAR